MFYCLCHTVCVVRTCAGLLLVCIVVTSVGALLLYIVLGLQLATLDICVRNTDTTQLTIDVGYMNTPSHFIIDVGYMNTPSHFTIDVCVCQEYNYFTIDVCVGNTDTFY